MVKFCVQVQQVHGFLVAEGYAPRLRYCGPLPNNSQEHLHASFVKSALPGLTLGPMQMIVMNYVSKCQPMLVNNLK
jgi:hypothetical protein